MYPLPFPRAHGPYEAGPGPFLNTSEIPRPDADNSEISSGRDSNRKSGLKVTFRQAKELGANVRKGEKGSLVVYANAVVRTETTGDGDEIEREIPFLKGYTVFNVEQIDGLPEQYYAKPEPRLTPVERIAHADAFFAGTRADIRRRGHQAFYAQAVGYIQLPPAEAFVDVEAYYSTLPHEVVHHADTRIMPAPKRGSPRRRSGT